MIGKKVSILCNRYLLLCNHIGDTLAKKKTKIRKKLRSGLDTHRFVTLIKDRLRVTGNDDLIVPFEQFMHLRDLGHVILYEAQLEQIKNIALHADSLVLRERFIADLFRPLGISIPAKRRDTRKSRDRVAAYRARLKERGYRIISFSVPLDEYKLLLELKEKMGASSYRDMFVKLAFERLSGG